MKYSAKYFINKFEPIPEDKWQTGSLGVGLNTHCALGHLGAINYGLGLPDEALALCRILPPPPSYDQDDIDYAHEGVVAINDGNYLHEQEKENSSPKSRIIAALHAALIQGK